MLAWALLPNHFHLLLRTTAVPLSDLMRCLNTGYAGCFNRRHRRSGYLFYNRFKSILVEEEPYLLELVRYIHLNPIRAAIVAGVGQLDDYPWTGHAALVGHLQRPWQATAAVLALFARREPQAREAYRRFVEAGAGDRRRPELTGGGLRRSRCGWLTRFDNVRGRDLWAFDERVLGSSDFVRQVLAETGHGGVCRLLPQSPQGQVILAQVMRRVGAVCGTTPDEIASTSHRPAAVAGRALVSYVGVVHLGLSSNAVARLLGVTRYSVRRALNRSDQAFAALGCKPEQLIA
ncbi:MAG: transposase [Candidatus Binatia bacterium]